VAYTSCETLDDSESTFITSSVECPACHGEGECLGHVIDELILQAEQPCQEMCQLSEDCQWFTYFADLKICLLMTDCPRLNTECANCFSSQKECGSYSTSTQQPTTTIPRKKEGRLAHVDGDHGTIFLVTLDGSVPNCNLTTYPYESMAALEYLPDRNQLAGCGGYLEDESDLCFSYNGTDWLPLTNSQKHCLYDTRSIFVENQGWWLSGLTQNTGGGCNPKEWSSQILSESGSWAQGPPHPRGYSNFSCIAEINATHTVFVPGEALHPETWIYDWSSAKWREMEANMRLRKQAGCALLPGRGILLAGGLDEEDSEEYSVELFDLTTLEWNLEPDLSGLGVDPREPTLLTWGDAVLGLFKYDDRVFERLEEGSWSPLEGVTLSVMFDGTVYDKAVLLPDHALPHACQ